MGGKPAAIFFWIDCDLNPPLLLKSPPLGLHATNCGSFSRLACSEMLFSMTLLVMPWQARLWIEHLLKDIGYWSSESCYLLTSTAVSFLQFQPFRRPCDLSWIFVCFRVDGKVCHPRIGLRVVYFYHDLANVLIKKKHTKHT